MTHKTWLLLSILFSLIQLSMAQVPTMKWKIHDPNRPNPAIITPGTASTQDTP